MPFAYPGTSMFTPEGAEIVAWSAEEFDLRLSEGCTEDAPTAEAVEPEPAKRKGVSSGNRK